MRQNTDTKTINIRARLPVGINAAGICVHADFLNIAATGCEIDELKAKVTAAYQIKYNG